MTGSRIGHVVVVGASLAGLRSAEALRRFGHDGPLTLIGAETHLPYDRPPLSKEVLIGTKVVNDVALTDSVKLDELDIEVRLGSPATRLDSAKKEIVVEDEKLSFDRMIIATGSHARRLADSPNLTGVHTIRTLDDAERLLVDLRSATKVVVVGGGFIGAEAASSARSLGCEVTVIEAEAAPMSRGLGEKMGTVCGLLHHDNGTDLRTGVGVRSLRGVGGSADPEVSTRVGQVELSDGTSIPADVVIVGIGTVPTTDWLAGSGLDVADGLTCDEFLCASPAGLEPDIYAAGDIAKWPNAWNGETMRVEHWTNAVEQGFAAAKNLLAEPQDRVSHSSIPFVWSDQYGHRIQIAGRPQSTDTVEVLAGSVDDRAFVAAYHRNEELTGVMAIDMIKPFVLGRRMLNQRADWTTTLAAFAAFD